MVTSLLYITAALYLGVLTSISPCPLATNIAAVSYIGRKVDSPIWVIQAGLLYTLGRCLLYLALAVALTGMALSSPAVSRLLQKYVHLVLGPVFLLLGMLLVGLVTFATGGTGISARMQKRVDAMGIWGALALGVLFAVSFCPTSAAWFFGLVALTAGDQSEAIAAVLDKVGIVLPATTMPGGTVLLPLIYGIGTALPVIWLAILLAFSAQSVGWAYNALARVEWWARMVTGWLFITLGAGFCLECVFGVPVSRPLEPMLSALRW